MSTETIVDYFALALPEGVEITDEILAKLTAQIELDILAQYDRPPKAILLEPIDWLITSDPDEVTRHQPAHDCAACLAGNDRARAFLAEFPHRQVVLANLRYTEVWTD